MKHLDKIANIAIIIAVLVFIGVVVRRELPRSASQQPSTSESLVGKTVRIPGLALQKQGAVVIVVSTNCHFCRESLPFYKSLTVQLKGKTKLVALLPQSILEGEEFLRDSGIQIDQVISGNPDSVGVYATPTVLQLDDLGRVKHAWVGRLDKEGEESLLKAVVPNTPS